VPSAKVQAVVIVVLALVQTVVLAQPVMPVAKVLLPQRQPCCVT